MMSGEELTEVVQITVEELHDNHPVMLENHEVTEDDMPPSLKRQRIEIDCEDPSVKSFLFSINQTICLRLDSIESRLQVLEATYKSLEEKLDIILNKNSNPIRVPMVAGSPLGATQTWNKVRCVVPQTTVILNNERQNSVVAKLQSQEDSVNKITESLENILNSVVPGRRHNTIVVKVPGPDESHSHDDNDSGSEASDTVSNSGHSNMGNNVTLITLNCEEDYPNGTWLGDENNPEMRVRCPITAANMLHISTNCRTAEKMALTLLDYLFHREVQAVSNLSGQGKHGKKQLDPLMIYGIRCHIFHKFRITESDWYRIKQSIDSKCRTAWRRKQRGQSLTVKSFSRRTPSNTSYNAADGVQNTVSSSSDLQETPPQALHYALANAQQVQIHQIGEDGQVQVGHLHIAQVPQGEQVQITQDSEGNLQIHQVHVGQDGQVLQGAQLIAVTSDPSSGEVNGSPIQANDIQVQYVQLAPVTEPSAATQVVEPLQSALQTEMHTEHESIQIQ
ncbi:protein BANP-like [Aquarana catesbeiana]|uniref:protein BANP-like n=1 Tax=Aquarana catesbeiana TaxID=8400 RepID=UPI003CCA4FD1